MTDVSAAGENSTVSVEQSVSAVRSAHTLPNPNIHADFVSAQSKDR